MTKPYMKSLVEEFGDPGLNRITDELNAIRDLVQEVGDADDKYEEYEPDGAAESRSIDRDNARAINRRYG